MLNKLKRSIRLGAPQVNLILNKNELTPGEKITGSFHLQGSLLKQKITRLECDLVQESQGKKQKVIEHVKTILMSKTITLKDKSEIPFHFRLTKELEPTSDVVSYRLRTKIVCQNDAKSIDHDEVIVRN